MGKRKPVSPAPAITPTVPSEPGFYWAKWHTACEGTPEGDEQTPSHKWEVVEVFVNGLPANRHDPEYFLVFIGGQVKSQRLECFTWGPGPLAPPIEVAA